MQTISRKHLGRRLLALARHLSALLLLCPLPLVQASAQSEAGLVVGAEAEKKLSKQASISVEGELRSRNDFKTMDRWALGIGGEYKLNKYLKASAGYSLLYTNFHEDIDYHRSTGTLNHWRPSYWGWKHRVHAALTGQYKLANNLRLSLRERWQYTYRPETTVDRWDFDDTLWQEKVRSARGKNQLRSRLQLAYDKKKALFTPYASVELYNNWGLEKTRYTLGTDIRLAKQHALSVYYRYQAISHPDAEDYDPDMHYVGVGYKFKF